MVLSRSARLWLLGGLTLVEACAPPAKPAEAPPAQKETMEEPAPDVVPAAVEVEPSEETPLTPEEVSLERRRALALAALRRSEATPDRLGVRAVLLARTSDVPWLLAVENQSEHPVEVLADPALLEFDVETPEAAPIETTPPKRAVPKKTDRVTCRSGTRPKDGAPTSWVKIEPGSLLTYSFDPRPLCEKDGTLQSGKLVTPRFGFPIETKKVWRKGKSEVVTNELEAPFLARRAEESAEIVPVKFLALEPFTLDETYPFDALTPTPLTPEEREAAALRDSLPLALSIRPLGTVADADETVVSVTLRNRGDKTLRLFYRREHLVYEIEGPLGPATCVMQPSDRAPEANAYDSLSPGESVSLATRLAEACPLGTFDRPGTYNVSVRLEAHHSGKDVGLEAFVGRIPSATPARLVVKNAKPGGRIVPVMRLVPARATRSAPSPAAPPPEMNSPAEPAAIEAPPPTDAPMP